jgi:hypothetical protein
VQAYGQGHKKSNTAYKPKAEKHLPLDSKKTKLTKMEFYPFLRETGPHQH